MHYNAMNVELIEQGSSIIPNPELNQGWDDITKLQWNLGCSIAWLKRYCGPVEIPKIQIGVDDFNENIKGKFAICVDRSGMYVDYHTAWKYIVDIFDGMRAVYNMKPLDVKVDIPVNFNYRQDHIIGKAAISRGEHTTEINIRLDEPMSNEMFDGMVAVGFAFIPGNPFNKTNH